MSFWNFLESSFLPFAKALGVSDRRVARVVVNFILDGPWIDERDKPSIAGWETSL
jgi:hypothetical protein